MLDAPLETRYKLLPWLTRRQLRPQSPSQSQSQLEFESESESGSSLTCTSASTTTAAAAAINGLIALIIVVAL